jgi:hypothetical protein
MNLEKELSTLHWDCIPGFPTKPESLKIPNFVSFKQNVWTKNNPVFVFFGCNDLSIIETIQHSKFTIDKLNSKGLDIFLYEPISSYLKDQKFNFGYFSEFDSNISYNDLRSSELDSIKKYVEINKLKKVTVHTCDYNIECIYSYYQNYFKLICNDLFLKQQTFQQEHIIPNNDFSKIFLVPNWRYSKHRHLVTSYIANSNSYYSWYYKCSLNTLKENSFIDIDKLPKNEQQRLIDGISKLNLESPISIDKKTNSFTFVKHPNQCYWPPVSIGSENNPSRTNYENTILYQHYRDSFCVIVNETRFAQPTANFSEKVLNSIKHKKPFILVAPPKTLEYLKSFGFKTFHNFWSEEYDNIENHEQRILEIFKIINYIESKDLTELRLMYRKMLKLLNFNYDLLMQHKL